MHETFTMTPVGRVVSTRADAFDDDWAGVTSHIELDPNQVAPSATSGLESFSHLEVLFVFDRLSEDVITRGARRPRGNPHWPEVGIFAQRGRNRPNRIGATVCEIVSVRGLHIDVRGLDAIDGTPVLDIKPIMSGFLPQAPIKEPPWAVEIMERYW